MLNMMQDTLLQVIADSHANGATEDAIADALELALERIRPEVSKIILETLKRNAPAMLDEHREMSAGFEQRNYERWRGAFDLFEMLIVSATELGEEHDKEVRPEAVRSTDYRFEALGHLFPKACLVAREMLWLLRGGYPDAAMSRWRTLFEFSVVALFLKENDQAISLRYLASFDFKALRAARELNIYAERAGLAPYTVAEMDALERRADAVEREIGCRLKKDYDWAHPALMAKFPKLQPDRIDFSHLQETVQLDHWRPYFRWAHQHVHAGHHPFDKLLGACESVEPVALVGPSNSGFVDPFSLGARSLINVTATFLMTHFNVDRAILLDVLFAMGEEIGPLAMQLEQETLAAARN